MPSNPVKLSISTQIRNLYSDGMSCLNMRFFNNVLSLSLYPFTGKDGNGKAQYDSRHGQQTTINYEAAFGLYQLATDIINGKIQECSYTIPCLGATITFDRKPVNNEYETVLSISKNNINIPFKFTTTEYTTNVNGQPVTKTLETGLGAFVKTLEGFLTGINADLHLNKLTQKFAEAQDEKNNHNTPVPQQQQQRQYQAPQMNTPRPYNNGYRNNRYGNNYQQNWGGPPQPMNGYQLPN